MNISKRTLFLIFILIAAVLGLLALSLQRPAPTPTPTPTPISFARTTLSLSEVLTSTISAQLSSNVEIDSLNLVTAVQIELSYNPQDLTNVDIKAGDFFSGSASLGKNPAILLKNVDEKNGRVSYALGINPGENGVAGKGTVAVLTFRKNAASSSTTTTISFLPKTLVSAEGITPSVLRSATGVTFSLK